MTDLMCNADLLQTIGYVLAIAIVTGTHHMRMSKERLRAERIHERYTSSLLYEADLRRQLVRARKQLEELTAQRATGQEEEDFPF